jgi:prepilin-type N-terminal cleavage/methylation domain-containing protein
LKKSNRGFTIMEILMALGVFSIMAAAASTLIMHVSKTAHKIKLIEGALSLESEIIYTINNADQAGYTDVVKSFLKQEPNFENHNEISIVNTEFSYDMKDISLEAVPLYFDQSLKLVTLTEPEQSSSAWTYKLIMGLYKKTIDDFGAVDLAQRNDEKSILQKILFKVAYSIETRASVKQFYKNWV